MGRILKNKKIGADMLEIPYVSMQPVSFNGEDITDYGSNLVVSYLWEDDY